MWIHVSCWCELNFLCSVCPVFPFIIRLRVPSIPSLYVCCPCFHVTLYVRCLCSFDWHDWHFSFIAKGLGKLTFLLLWHQTDRLCLLRVLNVLSYRFSPVYRVCSADCDYRVPPLSCRCTGSSRPLSFIFPSTLCLPHSKSIVELTPTWISCNWIVFMIAMLALRNM